MPKGANKKGKSKGSSKRNDEITSTVGSDDESIISASVQSVTSSRHDYDLDEVGDNNDNEANGETAYDDFEDKLIEAIDNTTSKSLKSRCAALEAIKKAFLSRYLFNFIEERKITLTDIIEKCIKRGKGEEQGIASLLSSIICITLGPGDQTELLLAEIKAQMAISMLDPTALASTRAKNAVALGICYFITGIGAENVEKVMESLVTVFSASFHKGNGISPTHTPEIYNLHSNALLAWALLLTIQPSSIVVKLAEKHLVRITEILDSPDVDLRIAAGETIAVVYEIAREFDEYFDIPNVDILCEKLKQLATDSQKFRAKKDRRVQRSSFRDVLKMVMEREAPYILIKFGKERLVIDSWSRKRQYDSFCHVLGSGMNLHLTENDLVRDVFELGPPAWTINGQSIVQKISKFERHMGNLAASKARTKNRSKLRDKRADVLG